MAKKNVLDYIEHIPLKTAKDVSQEIKWCEKMLLRTMRGDVEGYYRWHWLLCDSLEIYFDIKGIHYYGPKKHYILWKKAIQKRFIYIRKPCWSLIKKGYPTG